MTSTDIAPSSQRQPAPTDKPKRALQVEGKLKAALDLMVFGPQEGENAGLALDLAQACRSVGMRYSSMRKAIEKPHVRQYLSAQKQVFRAAASAQNISYAVKMRADAGNAMAQLGAMKFIEQDAEQSERSAASARTPGIVVQIINQGASEAKPVTTIDVVSAGRDDLSPDTSTT
jgi:hypothetical protein